jgi:hypothetical protein
MLYTILYLDKTMAFDITNFRASFKKSGEPASPTNYEVTIVRPPRIFVPTTPDFTPESSDLNNETVEPSREITVEDNLSYRCISCSLPGKMMATTDRLTYGPNRKVATGAVYQDIVFSFIVSDNMEEYNYFNNWQQAIVYNTIEEGQYSHDVAYYDDYVGIINIRQFGKTGVDPVLSVQLLECYPISVEEIPLGWEMNNEIIKINVTMAYRNWVLQI